MVVVVLTAGGALLALRAFNRSKERNPDQLHRVIKSIKQQAGVMAALCTAIFGVISALQSAHHVSSGQSSDPHNLPPQWGRRGRARIIDAIDEAVA